MRETKPALITAEIVFIIDSSKSDDTKQENLRFMKFNNFFPRCCLCGSKKFHFHYWRRERTRSIWIKSFRSDGRARMANLHTEGPLSEHNCEFQLHHVTKLLNASPRKKGPRKSWEKLSLFSRKCAGAGGQLVVGSHEWFANVWSADQWIYPEKSPAPWLPHWSIFNPQTRKPLE